MAAANVKHFKVTLVKSMAGCSKAVKSVLLGLGLKRRGRTVLVKDTIPLRGMMYKVVHMLSVEPVEGEAPRGRRQQKS